MFGQSEIVKKNKLPIIRIHIKARFYQGIRETPQGTPGVTPPMKPGDPPENPRRTARGHPPKGILPAGFPGGIHQQGPPLGTPPCL